ncbi:hypothetical protein Ari01nite_99170 [Paractinoplanes rishiriensis]|uniref:DUF7710 domain-containing protein n=1 Tax=Paractinoplanes rishiriensis TaxID=1050105 RepID=A0A919KAF0_9ACTN|nr:hypothetical protein Ari01nite_99170 [Actinoplanes rishiriensis]
MYVLPVSEGNAEGEVDLSNVWVFHGEEARFASGVFKDRNTALLWVELHELTGVITEYPLGAGCYDFAVAEGLFHPSKPHHGTPAHVAEFSPSGHHIHVRDGHPE